MTLVSWGLENKGGNLDFRSYETKYSESFAPELHEYHASSHINDLSQLKPKIWRICWLFV